MGQGQWPLMCIGQTTALMSGLPCGNSSYSKAGIHSPCLVILGVSMSTSFSPGQIIDTSAGQATAQKWLSFQTWVPENREIEAMTDGMCSRLWAPDIQINISLISPSFTESHRTVSQLPTPS